MASKLQYAFVDPTVPMDVPIEAADILRTRAAKSAIAHLAVEVGGRRARSAAYGIARTLRRVAARIDSGHMTIRSIDWVPGGKLGAEVWCCADNRIMWEVTLYAHGSPYFIGIEWRYGTGSSAEPVWRHASRVDVLLRGIITQRDSLAAARNAKREDAARVYAAALPDAAREIQSTCRATCLRVSADTTSVTEVLHDVGGSMSMRISDAPDLSAMQTQHDAIYHPERRP